jgi:hypothetical protein
MLDTPGSGLQPKGAELRKSPADQRMKFASVDFGETESMMKPDRNWSNPLCFPLK